MKWTVGIFLTAVMLAFNISAYADDWNASEHDYHISNCKNMRQRAAATDAPSCQNYGSGTAYGCCCDTCNEYLTECRNEKNLPKATCERIKTKCENDCNSFLSSQSPKTFSKYLNENK